MHPEALEIAAELAELATPERAAGATRFFKTGPGEYGEGDQFLGVTVPDTRAVCKLHRSVELEALEDLLDSAWHEHRLAAVLLLGERYRRGDAALRSQIYDLYLASTARINNWDLVDASADRVVGPHLDVVGTAILDQLAASSLLWDRRIAMIAPFHRIKRGEADTSLHVATLLLADAEPLIHKAVGWMLREIGKRVDESLLTQFLDTHAPGMPAVMLSYATERLTPAQRAKYRALRTKG